MPITVRILSSLLLVSLGLIGIACDARPATDTESEELSVHDICTAIACSKQGAPTLPTAGNCQNYACGGTWLGGVHFYTCCKPSPNAQCKVYQGASDGEYCNPDPKHPGSPSGGGCNIGSSFPMPTHPDGTCDTDMADRCNQLCLAMTPQIPGLCWSYTLCFNVCMNNHGNAAAVTCDGDPKDPNNACNGSCEY